MVSDIVTINVNKHKNNTAMTLIRNGINVSKYNVAILKLVNRPAEPGVINLNLAWPFLHL